MHVHPAPGCARLLPDSASPPSAAAASPRLTLACVVGAALRWLPRPGLCAHVWKVIHALLACRTPLLGSHHYRCKDCRRDHLVPHSCRNRHCPNCQASQAHDWLERQKRCLLPVHYFHIVFTLPHPLNALIAQNRKVMHDLLFASASATLLEFGQRRWQVRLGITAVLHTWSQTLMDHHHVHCIVTGGGITADGSRWRGARGGYLFPVRALSKVFRAKYRDGLQALFEQGRLQFHGQLAALAGEQPFQALKRQTVGKDWVVYAKRPFAGPEQVLAYLSLYTHRVAISNARLVSLDKQALTVTFGYRDRAHGSQRKTMTLGLGEFLRRFCLHILPQRFVKIRHYGLLANRGRTERIARAREMLQASTPTPASAAQPATEAPASTAALPKCPHCGSINLVLTAVHHKAWRIPKAMPQPALAAPDSS